MYPWGPTLASWSSTPSLAGSWTDRLASWPSSPVGRSLAGSRPGVGCWLVGANINPVASLVRESDQSEPVKVSAWRKINPIASLVGQELGDSGSSGKTLATLRYM